MALYREAVVAYLSVSVLEKTYNKLGSPDKMPTNMPVF
jgi:hypothetical protein